MNEREKFERHIDECIVSAEGLDEAIKKDGENYYIPWVQGKWLAWQAAKAESAAELAALRRELLALTQPQAELKAQLHTALVISAERASLLRCVSKNLRQGMSRSIQKLQAQVIDEEVDT